MVTAAKLSWQPCTESCVVASTALRSVDREIVGRNISEREDSPEIDRDRSSRPYPSTGPGSITTSTVGTQQQKPSPGVMPPPEKLPPAAQTLRGKLRGLVRHPDIDEALVATHIIGAVGDRRTFPQVRVVIDIDLQRLPLPTPGL